MLLTKYLYLFIYTHKGDGTFQKNLHRNFFFLLKCVTRCERNSDDYFACYCTTVPKECFLAKQLSLAYVIGFVPSFVFILMSLERLKISSTAHSKSFGRNNFYQTTNYQTTNYQTTNYQTTNYQLPNRRR